MFETQPLLALKVFRIDKDSGCVGARNHAICCYHMVDMYQATTDGQAYLVIGF